MRLRRIADMNRTVGSGAMSKYYRLRSSNADNSFMRFTERGAVLGSIFGIFICGLAGGLAAWSAVTAWRVDGVAGAILAAIIGMVVATALWAGGSTLLRTLGWIRR